MPSSPDDLAVIKVIRGAGADEIEVPRISTKLGVVTYNGHKVRWRSLHELCIVLLPTKRRTIQSLRAQCAWSFHMHGVVFQGLIHEDSTVEEIDEKEAVFVEQFRSGGIDIDDFQEIMVRR